MSLSTPNLKSDTADQQVRKFYNFVPFELIGICAILGFYGFISLILLILSLYLPSKIFLSKYFSTTTSSQGFYAWLRLNVGSRTALRLLRLTWIGNILWLSAIFMMTAHGILFVGGLETSMPNICLTATVLGVSFSFLTRLPAGSLQTIQTQLLISRYFLFFTIIFSSLFLLYYRSIPITIELLSATQEQANLLLYLPFAIIVVLRTLLNDVILETSQPSANRKSHFPKNLLYFGLVTLTITLMVPVDRLSLFRGLYETFNYLFSGNGLSFIFIMICCGLFLYNIFLGGLQTAILLNDSYQDALSLEYKSEASPTSFTNALFGMILITITAQILPMFLSLWESQRISFIAYLLFSGGSICVFFMTLLLQLWKQKFIQNQTKTLQIWGVMFQFTIIFCLILNTLWNAVFLPLLILSFSLILVISFLLKSQTHKKNGLE